MIVEERASPHLIYASVMPSKGQGGLLVDAQIAHKLSVTVSHFIGNQYS